MKQRLFDIRTFTADEVKDIHGYVEINVQYTLLAQLYSLTDNIMDKGKVFTAIYRIMLSCYSYVSEETTRQKLKYMLDESLDTYNKTLIILNKHDHAPSNYYKYRQIQNLLLLMNEIESKRDMDIVVDAFLVFNEQQILIPVDQTLGIDLTVDEGKRIDREARNLLDKTSDN